MLFETKIIHRQIVEPPVNGNRSSCFVTRYFFGFCVVVRAKQVMEKLQKRKGTRKFPWPDAWLCSFAVQFAKTSMIFPPRITLAKSKLWRIIYLLESSLNNWAQLKEEFKPPGAYNNCQVTVCSAETYTKLYRNIDRLVISWNNNVINIHSTCVFRMTRFYLDCCVSSF